MLYQYSSLQGLNWTRLLKIIPGQDSRPSFQLVEHDLDNKTQKYEAVSYAWGNTTLSSTLELGKGGSLPITSTLASALGSLVTTSSTGYLWIDQLCINQNDLEERNSQVSRMGEIYSGAETVLIWLGHDTDDQLELIQEMIAAIGSCPDGPHPCGDKGIMDPIVQKLAPLIDLERPAGLATPSRGELRRKAITALLSRAWWNRAWVFQETVLARSIKVLLGTSSIEWRDIEHVAEGVLRIEYEHGTGGYRNTIGKRASGWDAFEFMMHKHWTMKEKGTIDEFLGFMSQVGGVFRATDARDFIFAFAGLTNGDGVTFTPDYSQTVAEVYADATRAFIDRSESLDVLAFVRGMKHRKAPELPTWSPDWSSHIAMPMPVHDAIEPSVFHASGIHKHERHPESSSNSNFLLVRGKIIDEIKFVRYSHAFETYYFMEDLHEYLDIEGCFQDMHKKSGSERHLLTRERILRATIADDNRGKANRGAHGYLSDEHIAALWATYVSYPQVKAKYNAAQDRRNANPALWKLQQCSLVTQSKRVFISKAHKIGLTPSESGKGDKICILHGSKAPVVLRDNEDGTWMPIGVCFLEYVMFGEAITWDAADADTFKLS